MHDDSQNLVSENIPEWKLKLSYFYVNHKISIKRGLIFLLFFADILIIFFFSKVYINYQTGTIRDEGYMRQMPISLVNHNTVKNNYSPDELILSDAHLVSASANNTHILLLLTIPIQNGLLRK